MLPPTAADYVNNHEKPVAELRNPASSANRPQIVGPDIPNDPFPVRLVGAVQRGFGRGGKDLGCPTGTRGLCSSTPCLNSYSLFTANLPDESITPLSSVTKTGVYYGYAQVVPPQGQEDEFQKEELKVLPMVMSLGWNPFYKNERLTAVSPALGRR